MAEVTRRVPGGLLVGDISSVEVAADKVATDTPSPKKRVRKVKEEEKKEE